MFEVATFNGLGGDAFAINVMVGRTDRLTDDGSTLVIWEKKQRCLVDININTYCKQELKTPTS